jgi:hypothetical protein
MGMAQRVDRGMNWIVADRPNPDTRHSEMPSIKLSSEGYFTKNAGKLAQGRLSHKGKTR